MKTAEGEAFPRGEDTESAAMNILREQHSGPHPGFTHSELARSAPNCPSMQVATTWNPLPLENPPFRPEPLNLRTEEAKGQGGAATPPLSQTARPLPSLLSKSLHLSAATHKESPGQKDPEEIHPVLGRDRVGTEGGAGNQAL